MLPTLVNQVIKQEGCWDSKRPSHNSGYIQIQYGTKMIGFHRASWIINKGLVPDGLLVLHKCDNCAVVLILNIFLGTSKDNAQDI